MIAASLEIDTKEKQEILSEFDSYDRAEKLIITIQNQLEVLKLEQQLAPVSYTHLDVYKRQVRYCLWFILFGLIKRIKMQTLKINAAEENKGERLDKFIADNSDISRSYAAKLCEDGLVLCGEKQLLKKYKILGTEEITINVPEPEELSIEPETIPLNIVYEDSDVIVVNKPQGLCVHPAPGNESGTLVNGLVYHCGDELSAINGVIRPGIVHRIDKDTSGLLIVAKNNEAHSKLSEQLKERKAMRKYVALVNGNIKEDSGTINKPIGRNPSDRKKMAVVFGGRCV